MCGHDVTNKKFEKQIWIYSVLNLAIKVKNVKLILAPIFVKRDAIQMFIALQRFV